MTSHMQATCTCTVRCDITHVMQVGVYGTLRHHMTSRRHDLYMTYDICIDTHADYLATYDLAYWTRSGSQLTGFICTGGSPDYLL